MRDEWVGCSVPSADDVAEDEQPPATLIAPPEAPSIALSGAPGAGAWFDILDEYQPAAAAAAGSDPIGDESDTYLALSKDIERSTRASSEVAQMAGEVRNYRVIPMICFKGSRQLAERVAGLPDVATVLPTRRGFFEAETLVDGIDQLAAVERAQRLGEEDYEYLVEGIDETTAKHGYPRVQSGDPPTLDVNEEIQLVTPPALMPVLNMSVGTINLTYEARQDDPVNIATLVASRFQLVVVAAGNSGADDERETMSAWAEMPWVLSVGGTADEDGTELSTKSSRGLEGLPQSGPDLVAWGVSALDTSKKGTSFAAPRVTGLALVAAAAILQLRHQWQVASKQEVFGVQLVGAGFVDKRYEGLRRARVPLPALPLVGPDESAVRKVVDLAQSAAISLDVRGSPQLLRRMLLSAARPIPNFQPHQIGAGFLNTKIFLDWLGGLDGRHFISFFCGRAAPAHLEQELARLKLFKREELIVLKDVVFASMPLWGYDYATRKLGRLI